MKEPLNPTKLVLPILLLAVTSCTVLGPAPNSAPRGSPPALPTAEHRLCPQPTPEIFRIDPLTTPSSELQQVIHVRIGNGERVTVTTNAGDFVAIGDFTAYSRPADITITLLASSTTLVKVTAQVRLVDAASDCPAGGYVLTTDRDRNGKPLNITQIPAQATGSSTDDQLVSITATVLSTVSTTPTLEATRPAPSEPTPPGITSTKQYVEQPVCKLVLFEQVTARATRPAVLTALPVGSCITLRYKSGEEHIAIWYPAGSTFTPTGTFYVRRGTELVTIFTKGGRLMAREFVPKTRSEDLPLTIKDGKIILTASNTAVANQFSDGKWIALVDVLARQ